jgi:hypothetical protein
MRRFPTQMLEHVDVSCTAPVRPQRSLRITAIDEASVRRRRTSAITTLVHFAGVPRVGVLAVPARIGLGNRRLTPVPRVDAPRRFPVASIDLSRRDVGLPYGVPRFVNAATLKAIAGGRTVDQLLKKTHDGWEFVPDDTRIDLTDPLQEFRLGKLTIFS